jgi:hypothetical protein
VRPGKLEEAAQRIADRQPFERAAGTGQRVAVVFQKSASLGRTMIDC